MKFYNRELSWLAFNARVLQEAQDKNVPLIQRLRFLGIFSNNQDEFIKVRVANLTRLSRFKSLRTAKTFDGYPVGEVLQQVNLKMQEAQTIFVETYKNILQEMENHRIYVVNESQLNEKQKIFCRNYFISEISQWLIPIMVKKSTKLPFLSDNIIYHAVKMCSEGGKNIKYAIIQIPVNKTCPRFIELPSEKGRKDIIFLDDIIRLCLDEIFFIFNYDNITAHTFKFVRDAQLTVDDDISKSLMEKMEEGLEERLHGEPVRMAYDKEMPEDLLEIIKTKLKLRNTEILGGHRYHMMKHLMSFPVVSPRLENKNPPPLRHPDIQHFSSIIDVIRRKDIFLNYPYHTFNHLLDFLREAAIDPKVRRIYITLYRTAAGSKVINALINAAKNGKEVIVLEELMARFDEEQNIENSDLLLKSGVTVIHGFKGLKVHSKLILVERKEKRAIKGYAYVGTGNFNEKTAAIYGDYGIFTSNTQVVNDAKAVFDFLLNTHKHLIYKKLVVSPYFMRKQFEVLIENEIKNRKKGKNAFIYAKFNGLTDTKMIKLLYKASQAGVDIRLIIRGSCCIQPQVKGMSENIRAISIVDKYLEHARMLIFHNNGEEKMYILSADWMTRNLDNRIEVGIPVSSPAIRKTLKDIFNIQWADNVKARDLTILGENNYIRNGVDTPCRSQAVLYDYYKNSFKTSI